MTGITKRKKAADMPIASAQIDDMGYSATAANSLPAPYDPTAPPIGHEESEPAQVGRRMINWPSDLRLQYGAVSNDARPLSQLERLSSGKFRQLLNGPERKLCAPRLARSKPICVRFQLKSEVRG